ncbi:cysteine desulfurase [Cellvibrio japonicus]|uniref:Cysteine desulfurase n=1 Tax=Cellvibrio japonicus (strain Ueda107) TaxID=498211 RepID=B3PDL0_CELJU|nr:cysteine desulfurase [Cellvibrio japonicus]ACE83444.1 selenocysteine lyase [Cellvibrio japonicus Ueda107]QEI12023.1 cysteine desulfurase [Cellvibrio japonicus]QEI15598.1 cysteine desulfurase [Cellvibrio japonicus]QEI19176.1 cysteine desulfurase [Cellvibrio japonicus]
MTAQLEVGTRPVCGVELFDVEKVRADFPILHQQVNGQPLVYLDNAATTQKPNAVIDAISNYYREDNSNVHRGAHALADRATVKFEAAREKVAQFINAASPQQVIWTRGTTESINLVAASWGRLSLQPGDRILVSAMEHHSNIVPWQLVAQATGAVVEPIPVDGNGNINMIAFDTMLNARVKMVAVGHVSNAMGTINPVERIIALAHAVGARVLVDGAQAVSHWPVNMQALNCDFYVFSAHKLFGPTGLGVLYGKRDLLEAMPPYQGGGEMIESVSFSGTTYNQLPYKFEAGTPDIAGAIGMGAAIDYLNSIDRKAAAAHEQALLAYAEEKARATPGIQLVGTATHKASVMSFLIEGAHPADVGVLLDKQGVAVRTGNHCAQPIMDQFGIPGTVRASFSFYNTFAEVDRLFAAIEKAKTFLL